MKEEEEMVRKGVAVLVNEMEMGGKVAVNVEDVMGVALVMMEGVSVYQGEWT